MNMINCFGSFSFYRCRRRTKSFVLTEDNAFAFSLTEVNCYQNRCTPMLGKMGCFTARNEGTVLNVKWGRADPMNDQNTILSHIGCESFSTFIRKQCNVIVDEPSHSKAINLSNRLLERILFEGLIKNLTFTYYISRIKQCCFLPCSYTYYSVVCSPCKNSCFQFEKETLI